MRDRFGAEVESGLIEVICAPDSFYPSYIDGDGDKGNWKHALDVSFLMMYSQERAEFYLQLTDESHVSRGFVTKMQWFAMELEAKQYWMAIKYSEQGFAGNLFLSSELPRTIQFFLMFYNDQKIEDLFKNLVYAKACRPGMIQAECQSRMNKVWVKHKVPLIRVGSATRSRNNSDVAAVLVV
ncbi:alpha-1,3-mannosyl-glycoprotein 4-beta-N-acetylglucosaminyltransferase A-like [Frankliniella occidentalis]|uniref:Alpha-1,3-mannosyl-glycoprotein 4-beta-N-acetylglucosaminyltransferase A-like n=1 Tax=Frankliniella occidentalis TaxID=133901 RepID=A0A9C6XVF4_FRAOC|nr:alpha-1,3-mannosyl-glycoprotein 4-beta-N-acetylglucosaminyltransferase A-like [Frankliniella occidentalis]